MSVLTQEARSSYLRCAVSVIMLFLFIVLLSTSDTRMMTLFQASTASQAVPVPIAPTDTQLILLDTPMIGSSELADKPYAKVDDPLLHILLVGVDSGESGFDHGRTDSIILVSLDPNGEKIKLTSFMRDLYVEIPGHGYSKINAAHAWGGMKLLKDTLAKNFGLALDRHVVIDFSGFERAIDLLGGVEIEIKDYEVPHVNVSGPGVQHLSGSQALHYVRLRYAGNSDYERTERQRRVLAALVEKAKQLPMSDYYRLYREIEPYIRTNFSILETLRIGYISLMLKDAEVETLRIPVEGTYESTYRQEMAVLVPDLDANIAQLDAFLRPVRDPLSISTPAVQVEPYR